MFIFFLESTKIVALVIFGILKLISAKVSLTTYLKKVKIKHRHHFRIWNLKKRITVKSPISITSDGFVDILQRWLI